MSTAFISHSDFNLHHNGDGHPERPSRLEAIAASLKAKGLWNKLIHPPFAPATNAQLEYCHTQRLIEQIHTLAENGGAQIDPDTRVTKYSFDIAKLAVGAALGAVDGILKNDYDTAFVAARPPGHHAESNRAMGFCLFNSVAIAARHAQRAHGLERVAILDWDVHHGNGTQEIFYSDGSVFFASVHQSPLFPYNGQSTERGRGDGEGTTLNFPLEAGHGDTEYLEIWEHVGAALKTFRPQLILVSAGYDAHFRDPLGGMRLTAAGFAGLTQMTQNWADTLCGGRLICILEGGYDLEGLSESATATIETLSEKK
jgi:acetoin utilization deacetylase AcuC-like enzyme